MTSETTNVEDRAAAEPPPERSLTELLDDLKFLHISGIGNLQHAADRVSVLAAAGAIKPLDLELLHNLLRLAADDLVGLYSGACEHLVTDGVVDASVYSDGAPTFTTSPAPDFREDAIYSGDIGWPHIEGDERLSAQMPPHLRARYQRRL